MLERMNQRVKKLNAIDISLIKWSSLFATMIIVKLFPQLLQISYLVLVILMVLCMFKPVYVLWLKK
jgi:hypothetical protein